MAYDTTGSAQGTFEQQLTALGDDLRKLSIRHNLTYEKIAARARTRGGRNLTATTVSEALNGTRLLGVDLYMTLVSVLVTYDSGRVAEKRDPQLQEWRDRWEHLKLLQGRRGRSRPTFPADGGLAAQILLSALRRGESIQMYPMADDTDGVWDVAFSPDGTRLATAHGTRTAQLWDTIAQKRTGQALVGHKEQVEAVAFSPEGALLATASADETVRLWDVETHDLVTEPLDGHSGGAWAVAFSPDGRLLATAGKSVRLWDVTDPARPQKTKKQLGVSLSARPVFSSRGILATGHTTGSAQLWDPFEKIGAPLRGHQRKVTAVAFSPDGTLLATASQAVQLWDVNSQEMVGEPLKGHGGFIPSMSFSPDGRLLAVVSGPAEDDQDQDQEHAVRLWDTSTWTMIGGALGGHTDVIWGAAFSPVDSRLYATGSADGLLCLRVLPAPPDLLEGQP